MTTVAGAAALATLGRATDFCDDTTQPTNRYVSNFYQFGREAVDRLSAPDALPNGERFLHIFAHSSPGFRGSPELVKRVHAAGASYKFAQPIDVHKYEGWPKAAGDQLKRWAEEFRTVALDEGADYFAFNEMPTTGAQTPALREQVATWLRLLHESGGGRKLPGVFYFTEKNLNPKNWTGDADAFWEALDQTCELIVGEHYHNWGFVFDRTVEQYADHLFALPKWLIESGKAPQTRVARDKYCVLHSSYYGPNVTGWAGIQNDKFDFGELKKYFRRMVDATRASRFGKSRIAFGPLANKQLDLRLLDPLAEVLGDDARA